MSCACDGSGFVYDDASNTAYNCACRGERIHRAAAANAEKRSARARANGRRGGLAAGVRRRQLARSQPRPPRRRGRQQALALTYPVRQLSRAKFEALYERTFPRPERGTAAASWERGRETAWTHYRTIFRRYRACGQHFVTTRGQRSAALAAQGRERCPRTVQRLNRALEAMGVCAVRHDRRGGAKQGNRDVLIVEVRSCVSTPSSGGGATGLRPEVAPSPPTKKEQTFDRSPATASVPAASPPDEVAADAADGNGIDERGAAALARFRERCAGRERRRLEAAQLAADVARDELAPRRRRPLAASTPPPAVRSLPTPQGVSRLELNRQRAAQAAREAIDRQARGEGDWWRG